MAEQFYTILTKIGMAILANSAAMGNKVNFLKVKLGDGNGSYYNPSDTQTELVNQVWEGNVGSVKIDEENSNWIIVETVIPATDGGFYIREGGVYDDKDNLIAISKLAETYKPLASEGSSKDLIVRQIFEISNADSVTLKLDPTVILATKKDVQVLQTSIDKINAQLNNMMYETAGGSATAITLTMPTTLKNGYWKKFIASADNGGAATTINGKPVYKPCTTSPPNFKTGKAYEVWFNLAGNNFFWKASAEGNAVAANVLAGTTFSNDDDSGIPGTMVEHGNVTVNLPINGSQKLGEGHYDSINISQKLTTKSAATYTPTTKDQTIAANQWISGIQTIKGDANLIASNLKENVTIFGIKGTCGVTALGGYKGTKGKTSKGSGSAVTIQLNFTPNFVFAYEDTLNNVNANYSKYMCIAQTYNSEMMKQMAAQWNSSSGCYMSNTFKTGSNTVNIGTNSITLQVTNTAQSSVYVHWIALEI